jgi:hypothetical protein
MGLATAARCLPGFVKGLDLAYVPPEHITCVCTDQQQQQQQQQHWEAGGGSASASVSGGSSSRCWQILGDLSALAQLTTTAADMYQLVSWPAVCSCSVHTRQAGCIWRCLLH